MTSINMGEKGQELNISRAENKEKLNLLTEEKKNIEEKGSHEMNVDELRLTLKALELEILDTQSQILQTENELGLDNGSAEVLAVEEEAKKETDAILNKINSLEEVIAEPENSLADQETTKRLLTFVDNLNEVCSDIAQAGVSLNDFEELRYSSSPKDVDNFNRINEKINNYGLDDMGEIMGIMKNNPALAFKEIGRLNEPDMVAHCFKELTDEEISPRTLVAGLFRNETALNKNFEELKKNVEEKLDSNIVVKKIEQYSCPPFTIDRLKMYFSLIEENGKDGEIAASQRVQKIERKFLDDIKEVLSEDLSKEDVDNYQEIFNIVKQGYPGDSQGILGGIVKSLKSFSIGSETYKENKSPEEFNEYLKKFILQNNPKLALEEAYEKLDLSEAEKVLCIKYLADAGNFRELVKYFKYEELSPSEQEKSKSSFAEYYLKTDQAGEILKYELHKTFNSEQWKLFLKNNPRFAIDSISEADFPEASREELMPDYQIAIVRSPWSEKFKTMGEKILSESKDVNIWKAFLDNMGVGSFKDIYDVPVELRDELTSCWAMQSFFLDKYDEFIKAATDKNLFPGIEEALNDIQVGLLDKLLKFPGMNEEARLLIYHNLKGRLLQFPEDKRLEIVSNLESAIKEGPEDEEDKKQEFGQINKIKNYISTELPPLPEAAAEKMKELEDKYGKKGKTLGILALYTYEGMENPEKFLRKIEKIEEILSLYKPENIPDGGRVSFGVEYEVTDSVGEEYQHDSAFGYVADIRFVSQHAGVGQGMGGMRCIHEIATKPTENPYILLAEMSLLQEAGFVDFNFSRYPKASRGYHLNLSGESGLAPTGNIHFLNNLLTISGLTGINAGKEVGEIKHVYERGVDGDLVPIFIEQEKKVGVEIKGGGADTWEQFEKTILTSFYAGIAIQLEEKYPEGAPSAKETEIISAWRELKEATTRAIAEHNSHFIERECFGGYVNNEGEYIETSDDVNCKRNRDRLGIDKLSDVSLGINSFYHIPATIFEQQSTKLPNALTRINNLFLKPPAMKSGEDKNKEFNSPVNARNVLEKMKLEGYSQVQIEGSPEESIFDRQGETREGYYYVQDASEEMITHKSQILINQFNQRIKEIISQRDKKSNPEKVAVSYE